ncbi:MAG: NAD-dependent epimerase/dehydratase family protein [Dehalococcoidia bacterium]
MVVLGGAGFIGSHLMEALLGQGHEVVSLEEGLRKTIEWFASRS